MNYQNPTVSEGNKVIPFAKLRIHMEGNTEISWSDEILLGI